MEDYNYDSRRANLYKKNIANFKCQTYLKMCQIKKFYFSMSRLRLSGHRLCIETGKRAKPNPLPINDRKCSFCNLLEAEYHFVLECSLYRNLCTICIPIYYRNRPYMNKLVHLFRDENETIIRKYSIYGHSPSC